MAASLLAVLGVVVQHGAELQVRAGLDALRRFEGEHGLQAVHAQADLGRAGSAEVLGEAQERQVPRSGRLGLRCLGRSRLSSGSRLSRYFGIHNKPRPQGGGSGRTGRGRALASLAGVYAQSIPERIVCIGSSFGSERCKEGRHPLAEGLKPQIARRLVFSFREENPQASAQ